MYVNKKLEELNKRVKKQESKLYNSANYNKKFSADLKECVGRFGHASESEDESKIIEQISFLMPEVLISQTGAAEYGEVLGLKGKETLKKYLAKIQLLEDDSDAERIGKLCAVQNYQKSRSSSCRLA